MSKRKKITKGTINFILKTNKLSKEGLAPLYIRYSYKGVPIEYALKLNLVPINWDDSDKSPIYISKAIAKKVDPNINYNLCCNSVDVQDILASMSEVELDIKEIEAGLPKEFTSSEVINELKIKRGEIQAPVPEDKSDKYFTDYLFEYNSSVKTEIKHPTWVVYNTIANLLVKYELKKGRKFLISEIGYDYLKGLGDFMCLEMQLLNSTIVRRISNIKGHIEKARIRGYSINNSYKDYSWSDNEKEIVALTLDEVRILEDMDLSGKKHLERVRDVFLFGCYTGLRFSDIRALKKFHIKENGIRMTSQKTSSKQFIPLTRKSKNLIEKYISEENDHVFPVGANQMVNRYLKMIGREAEFNELIEKVRFSGSKRISEVKHKWELLTMHIARKTFVTISMEMGMSEFEVMSVTGHKDFVTFKKYYKINENIVSESLLNAWEK